MDRSNRSSTASMLFTGSEQRGVPVVNFALCHRALGRQVLHDVIAAGCRTADARDGRVRRRGRGDELPSGTMRDVVIKPIFGSMGHGLDPRGAIRIWRSGSSGRSNSCGLVFYVQRVIDHAGCDIRVFVVGGRMARRGRATCCRWGDWRTNVASGHVYMVVGGLRFDTSGRAGRRGSRWQSGQRPPRGFVARHWPGY